MSEDLSEHKHELILSRALEKLAGLVLLDELAMKVMQLATVSAKLISLVTAHKALPSSANPIITSRTPMTISGSSAKVVSSKRKFSSSGTGRGP